MTLDNIQITLVDSVDDAGDFMRWLSTKDTVAFDTETTGLDICTERVRLVQYGDETQAWVIPFERWSGVVYDAVSKFEGHYVMHNMPYDTGMCENHGIKIPKNKVRDTRLEMHVLESTGSLALKTISKRLVDPRADAGQRSLDEALSGRGGWTWATVPYDYEPYWTYAGFDTILTKHVDNQLWPRVRADAPRSYELEAAAVWIALNMQRKGVRVDREYTGRLMESLETYVVEVEKWCQQHYGVYPGSNKDVGKILYDEAGLTEHTPSGALKLDKEILGDCPHPLAQAVLGRRQGVKLVSTYLTHFLELSTRDGRIHPSINTVGGTGKNPFEPGGATGVRTGRMSMNNPNLQNVPVRTKEGKKIRRCFVPDEGNVWIKCDADQIEMRLLAHLANEPKMIDAFVSEGDFFVNLARDLFAEPSFQKSDPRRQMVKNGGYAKIYGAGVGKFAKTAGVQVDEAAAFMRRFDALFDGIPRWVREVERLGRERLEAEGVAYVRSPLTGRRHVADAGRLYTLVNYLIQGTAGELLKLKMVEADHAGLGDYMILPVHDEVDLDVPRDDVPEVLTTLTDVMNDDQLLRVPLTWSAETGPSWGECE